MSDIPADFMKPKKHRPTYRPIRVPPVAKGTAYASTMVSSQETMLEHLRYLKRQMAKDDAKLKNMQDDLYMNQYPRKWTPPYHQKGFDREGEEEENPYMPPPY